MTDIFLSIYIAGLVISLFSSVRGYYSFQQLKQRYGLDVFDKRKSLKVYLIIKPFLWPYYLIIEKNPVEFFSELFFKHYGDSGHTYFGDHGLKNFLKDIFHGRSRYAQCQPQKALWVLNKIESEYSDFNKNFDNMNHFSHAAIIYTHFKGQYLLSVTFGNKNCLENEGPISRFQLDRCERLSEVQFKERLLRINSQRAYQVLNNLKTPL